MQTIIVYVDDADHAQLLLQAAAQESHSPNAHWILVACAPRITHRVSKFASNRSRENWRNKWAERLFDACVPALQAQGLQVTTVLARTPLPELLASLQAEYGPQAQVLDMRRPKLAETEVPEVQGKGQTLRKLAGTLTGIGALWTVLIGDTLAA